MRSLFTSVNSLLLFSEIFQAQSRNIFVTRFFFFCLLRYKDAVPGEPDGPPALRLLPFDRVRLLLQ